MKPDKIPCIIYTDIESLINKIDGCENNPEHSSTRKIGEQGCGYLISTIWGFDHIEDKHTLYRVKDCMKKLYESLREHAKSIIDIEKEKMLLLKKKKIESHRDANICHICVLIFFKKLFRDKNYRKN